MLDTIEIDGRTYSVRIERDEDMGAPWDEHDGHGIVTDWERRSKAPDELILAEDRGAYRFYNVRESITKATKEGWDAQSYNDGRETKRQQAAKAVRADYEYLRAWCDDRWHWCGVIVTDDATGAHESLWGIASDDEGYLDEVARELADSLHSAHAREIAEQVEREFQIVEQIM